MYDEIARNKRRTWFLLGLLTLLLAMVSGIPLSLKMGRAGWFVGVLVAAVVVIIAYYISGWLALRLGGAREVKREDYPRLFNLVEGLCIAGGVPMPKICVVEDDAPNAFASGRSPQHAAIAVTTGLLARMNRAELEGVLAHELSHIRNYDTLVATAAVVLAGAIELASTALWFGSRDRYGRRRDNRSGPDLGGTVLTVLGFALALLAPFLAQLVRFAISRNRETLADVSAADLTRYPPGLISALQKLRDAQPAPGAPQGSTSGAIAHLWFASPARVASKWAARRERLYATHPPIDERINALRQL
jgi:heat shock protein HtpX